MSKNLFSFMIGELKVVRLICKQNNCGAIAEIDVAKLSKRKSFACPCCKVSYEDSPDGPLFRLGRAIAEIENNAELDVEFVLPVKS